MKQGWIKLHRKLLDNPVSNRPLWFSVWVHLLLMANHDDEHSFIWNDKKLTLKSGQFVTGRKEMARICGVSESLIERVLKWLEIEHQIEQQKTTKYRLITILNWELYQKSDNTSDSKKTTKRQQKDTFKNVRMEEDKNNTTGDVPSQEIAELIDSFKEVNPMYSKWFGNKTQRSACERLITVNGLDKVKKVIALLPKTNGMDFMPVITSPIQLEDKFAQLATALQKYKNNQPIML